MKILRKLWFIFCMGIVVSFGLTACVNEAEQKKIDALVEKNVGLVKQLDDAYDKHQAGQLTTKELAQLTSSIKVNIEETKAEVSRMKEEGVGTLELVGATLLGIISRGIPSKGPLATAFSMLTARREE